MFLYYDILLILGILTAVQANDNNASFFLTATPTPAYIKTPNYPENYLSNMNYTWLIESEDRSEVIMFLVEDCFLEFVDAKNDACQLDTLTINDGQFANTTKLYEGCCLPGDSFSLYNSSGPFLLITFVSDANGEEKGFRIKYYNSGDIEAEDKEEEEEGADFAGYIGAGMGGVVAIAAVIVIYYLYKKKKLPRCTKSSGSVAVKEEGVAACQSDRQADSVVGRGNALTPITEKHIEKTEWKMAVVPSI